MNTDLTILMDRSGSMHSCCREMQDSLNKLLCEQREQPDPCKLTVIMFDHAYDPACRGVPIQEAPTVRLEPRGNTALLDAMGRALHETAARLEAEPPGNKVIFVVVTDGQENSSKEYTKQDVQKLVQKQQEAGWHFTFLGANQDAFAEAGGLGFSQGSVANYSTHKAGQALSLLSDKLRNVRSGDASSISYSDEERSTIAE